MNPTWNARFMDHARSWAMCSADPTTKVGAVVVNDHAQIVGHGYNHFPRPLIERPEVLADREAKYKRVVHAEVAALWMAGERARGGILYSTLYVCPTCVPLIILAGVQAVVTPPIPEQREAEGWGEGAAILGEAGIHVLTVF